MNQERKRKIYRKLYYQKNKEKIKEDNKKRYYRKRIEIKKRQMPSLKLSLDVPIEVK